MLDRSTRNDIFIEQGKNGCVIRVGEKVLKRSLGTAICARISELGEKGRATEISIDLRERTLSAEDAEKLKKYVTDHCGVAVRHIYCNTADISRRSGTGSRQQEQASWSEARNTLFVRSTVRCGQTLSFEGSIVLIGGLNSGGFVEAGQSIVVLGELCGTASAGRSGAANSFIYAGSFRPVKVAVGAATLSFSQIPENLMGRGVMCSLHQNELILRERFDQALPKGCVSIG